MQTVLARLSPSALFAEVVLALLDPTTRALGPVYMHQLQGAVVGAASVFTESLLMQRVAEYRRADCAWWHRLRDLPAARGQGVGPYPRDMRSPRLSRVGHGPNAGGSFGTRLPDVASGRPSGGLLPSAGLYGEGPCVRGDWSGCVGGDALVDVGLRAVFGCDVIPGLGRVRGTVSRINLYPGVGHGRFDPEP